MQALLASSCPHQVTAFSAGQHQRVCNCAQPSLPRQRSPLGAQQHVRSSLTRQGLCLTATRSKRLHISHAIPPHSTKETDHRPASETADSKQNGLSGQTLGIIALLGGLAVVLGLGYLFKGKIRHFLDYFIEKVDEWGPWGYVAYGALYTALEIVALPAIPLTMTAGVLFGIVPGTIVVSGAATLAATIAFLIARYAARDKVLQLAQNNSKYKAIDRAIGKESFKVVTLLRLSPLLPLALSNYFYGITSVDLPSYVAGSWLGMLPGTIAYVYAGNYGRALIDGDGDVGGVKGWQVALGLGITVLAVGYIGKLAKKALDDVEQEEGTSSTRS
ncbi:hypothetical protein ABBQ38_012135 [Trebouxia sp. C0009 RCD-2024]